MKRKRSWHRLPNQDKLFAKAAEALDGPKCTCWNVQYSSAVAVVGQTERNPECPIHGDEE